MDMKILVAYATKYGATAAIAKSIGETLQQAGLPVVVLPVEQAGSLDAYRAVVLGSAVYVGQWRKEAAAFLQANQETLALMPVWLFSSGPTGEGDPVELMNGFRIPEGLKPIIEAVKPHDIVVFHGVLDMKKLTLPEKLVTKGLKAPIGDYRDWDAVNAWAKKIAAELDLQD